MIVQNNKKRCSDVEIRYLSHSTEGSEEEEKTSNCPWILNLKKNKASIELPHPILVPCPSEFFFVHCKQGKKDGGERRGVQALERKEK